jgi:hypothetical protein
MKIRKGYGRRKARKDYPSSLEVKQTLDEKWELWFKNLDRSNK